MAAYCTVPTHMLCERCLSAFLLLSLGQVHPTAHVIMNRTNARISLDQLEIRGEDGDKQVAGDTCSAQRRTAGSGQDSVLDQWMH